MKDHGNPKPATALSQNAIFKNIGLMLFSTLFMLLLIEMVFRLFFPQIQEYSRLFQPDNTLGWKFIPEESARVVYPGEANHKIYINKEGYRDPGTSTKKSRHIWVIGDSFVSNIAVTKENVFTEQLEAKFQNTEVHNYGVNGYNTIQEYLLLQQLLAKNPQPDLIVMFIYLRNDFKENLNTQWLLPRPVASLGPADSSLTIIPPDLSQVQTNMQRLNNLPKSHFWVFTETRLRNIKHKFSDQKPFRPQELQYCNRQPDQEFQTQANVLNRMLQKIDALSRQHNIPLLFVLAPSMFQAVDLHWNRILNGYPEFKEQLDREFSNRRLMAFASHNDLRMIDLYPVLQNHQSAQDQPLYHTNEQHWTPFGNQVVATALFSYLKEHYSFN